MTATEVPTTEYLPECPVGRIHVDAINPRSTVAVDDDFVASIAAGILEPLIVRVDPANPQLIDEPGPVDFLLVAGHRRHLAAQQAGLEHVPVVVRHDLTDDRAALVAMIVENSQREDLPPLDEAHGIETLVGMGMSQREVAKAVGREQSTVSKRLSLLKLPTRAQQLLASERITVKTALGLTGLIKHNDRMSGVLDWAAQHGDADDPLIAREVAAHLEAVAFEKDRTKRAKAGEAEPESKPEPLDMKVDDRTDKTPDDDTEDEVETYAQAVEREQALVDAARERGELAAINAAIVEAAHEYVTARFALENRTFIDSELTALGRLDTAWAALLAACGRAVPTEDIDTVDEPAPPAAAPKPGDPCPYCLDGRVVFDAAGDWRKATVDDLGTSPCPDCEGTGTFVDHDTQPESVASAEKVLVENPQPDDSEPDLPDQLDAAIENATPDLPDLPEPWKGYETFGAARNIKVIGGTGPWVTPDSLQAVIDYEQAREPSRQKIIDAAHARIEQLAAVNA